MNKRKSDYLQPSDPPKVIFRETNIYKNYFKKYYVRKFIAKTRYS